MKYTASIVTVIHVLFYSQQLNAQCLVRVGEGWAGNSVNVTVFRKNSVVTEGNTQFVAYYDAEGFLMLAKRKLNDTIWETNKTQYKGNVKDAHNSISIITDGEGYLHVSWDHHGSPLRYAKSKTSMSLELEDEQPMTGVLETNVTYPEFYKMPDGGLIFMYRDGQSGQGNLVLNRYDLKTHKWRQVQQNLIDGQKQRNAYWQACVDNKGTIHLSWVWRETPDVATNHDLCYAKSLDGGETWLDSKNKKYTLPITAETAECAYSIPQNSELINQTSMTTDESGNPYIATYWRDKDSSVPQYHIVYHNGKRWVNMNLGFRKTSFSLKGGGTKRIPVSRPQVLAETGLNGTKLYMIFRDQERGEKVSVAVCDNIEVNQWKVIDLTDFSVGAWEPTFDTELWRQQGLLHIFVQKAEQVDAEGIATMKPEPVQILEVNLKIKSV